MSANQKSRQTFERVCDTLHFTRETGLVADPEDTNDDYLRQTFYETKWKLNIDAIFFLKPEEGGPSAPLIYFRMMPHRDASAIAELHKLTWNIGKAPLLFVILPDSVLVYNNLVPPSAVNPHDDEAGLIQELTLIRDFAALSNEAKQFERAELETGNYWRRNAKNFRSEHSVFRMLLNNLDEMRLELLRAGLSRDLVHSILIRSIFIKYLEDRRDNQRQNVFPSGFFDQFVHGANCFTDLLADKKATYRFFRHLAAKFNGDVFIVEEDEEGKVQQDHLNLLRRMLRGEEHIRMRQMVLWPLYSFDVIPIQLISSIYEQFLRPETFKQKVSSKGIHYTPYNLVEYLMDKVLPLSGSKLKLRILDPACGSGIFLVESYRRLVARWMKAHEYRHPSPADLVRILKENIFGVDEDAGAIRIAALSLYLTLCEYLKPKTIWNEVKFERLIGKNLFISDFFNPKLGLNGKFDLIVGNPPWRSSLPHSAESFVRYRQLPVGDKQICQAFLWKVAELCGSTGRACIIVSSMALLFNRSATNRAFRKRFFSSYKIEEIVNFSALRHFLFSEAVGPGVAVIFSSGHPTGTESILYLSPKPSFTIQDDLSFVIEPQDRAEIPLKEASDSQIVWKVAMWGSPRDYELARKLSQHRTLDYVSKSRGWIYGEGYIEGTKKSPTKDLFGKLEVTPHSLTKFVVKTESLKRCQKKAFYRWAKTKLGIYRGPHLLIAQSPRAEGDFVAAVMREDSVFSCRIAGVHGSTSSLNDLISVCQVVNSDLYAYFEMLTSGRWLVERDDLEVKETMNLPIPDKLLGRDLDYKFLERLASDEEFRKAEQNKLMSFYGISDIEREIIQDTIRFTLDYFRNKGESNAIKPPSEPSVEEYLKALCDILNQQFASSSMNFGRIRYLTDAPLRVVSLRLSADRADRLTEVRPREEMNTLLRELDNSLIEEKAAGIYIRRHLRRYSSDSVHIIKPNQARYWTRSSAFVDADKIYAEIMRSWSAARVEMP